MIKQPKYFQSKEKQSKPVIALSETTETVEAPLFIAEESGIVSRLGAYRQHLLLGLSVFTLTSLATLVFLPRISDARIATLPLPSFFPKIEKSSTVVTQEGGGGGQGLTFDVQVADARVEIVASFLTRYKSPLVPAETYGKILVDVADKHGLDYRLLPAIMMQESNLCKTSDPALHNCLGFGIHERGTLGFESYEAGFDRAAREIKANYIDIGLTTPELMQKKYTPSSNGSWANSVNQWIAEMEHNDRQKGIESTQDANLLEYTKE